MFLTDLKRIFSFSVTLCYEFDFRESLITQKSRKMKRFLAVEAEMEVKMEVKVNHRLKLNSWNQAVLVTSWDQAVK